MSITYNYGPRQIGKTTAALNIYKSDPNNTAIFFHNYRNAEDVTYNLRKEGFKSSRKIADNFFSYPSSDFKGRHFDTIILDEFDFVYKHQTALIHALIPMCNNIIIYTTPSFQRDRVEYMFVKNYKLLNRNGFSDIWEYFAERFPEVDIDDKFKDRIAVLLDDVITESCIKLNKMPVPDWWVVNKERSERELGKERYQTEIEGNLFK